MRISNLSNKSGNPSSSDYFVLDDGTTVTKIDYNKLAKAIIENYAGSNIAGSAQTLKAALDSLNSKTSCTSIRSGSFNDLALPGYYWVYSGVTEAPVAGNYFWRVRVEEYSGAPSQYANRNGSSEIYFRCKANNVWIAWTKIA